MKKDIQSAVAREAGKSFETVVRDYARLGHSMTETALLLGYAHHKAFIKLCERHGWTGWFRRGDDTVGGQRARESRRGSCSPAQRKAAHSALKKNPHYQPFEYRGVMDTWAGHSKRIGISVHTVRQRKRRRPGDMDYIFSLRSHSMLPSTKNHFWRKDFGGGEK